MMKLLCRTPVRNTKQEKIDQGAFPGGDGLSLPQALDAPHLAGSEVGLCSVGFILEMDFEVVPSQGVPKRLIRIPIKGLLACSNKFNKEHATCPLAWTSIYSSDQRTLLNSIRGSLPGIQGLHPFSSSMSQWYSPS